jgi:hypothetical protein
VVEETLRKVTSIRRFLSFKRAFVALVLVVGITILYLIVKPVRCVVAGL